MNNIIIPGRILGIFWTTASWVSSQKEQPIQVSNKDRGLLEEVNSWIKDKYNTKYSIYHSPIEEKRPGYEYNYYRMKIYNPDIINLLREKYNWRGRKH
jgi:hypothetical protein